MREFLLFNDSSVWPENGKSSHTYEAWLTPPCVSAGPPINKALITEKLPREQAEELKDWHLPPLYLSEVKHEINSQALSPKAELIKSMQESRVVALGEMHDSAEKLRKQMAQMLDDLKQAGATHLFLEMPETMQPSLDNFLATGSYDEKNSPDPNFYLLEEAGYRELLLAAKKAGITVRAVDMPDYLARDRGERNKYMAETINKTLAASPENKAIFWGGNNHLNNTGVQHSYISLSGYLRNKHYPVTTVWTEIDDSDPLVMLSPDLKETVAIRPCKTQYLGRMLSSNPELVRDAQPFSVNDLVLIVPPEEPTKTEPGRPEAINPSRLP